MDLLHKIKVASLKLKQADYLSSAFTQQLKCALLPSETANLKSEFKKQPV